MQVLLTEVFPGRVNRIAAMGTTKGCELLQLLEVLHQEPPYEVGTDQQAEAVKMAALLRHVAECGIPRNEQKCRVLKGTDLFEFKTTGGLRILAFWDEGRLIVCTHGFMKKSQKTPKKELERGMRLREQYFAAKTEGRVSFA